MQKKNHQNLQNLGLTLEIIIGEVNNFTSFNILLLTHDMIHSCLNMFVDTESVNDSDTQLASVTTSDSSDNLADHGRSN